MKDYKEKIFSIIDLNNKINSYDEDSQNINMVNVLFYYKYKQIILNQVIINIYLIFDFLKNKIYF